MPAAIPGSPEGLGWGLDQDRAELQKLLGIEIPQDQGREAPHEEHKGVPRSQRETANRGQSGEATQAPKQEISVGLGWETPQGENEDALKIRKDTGQSAWERRSLSVGKRRAFPLLEAEAQAPSQQPGRWLRARRPHCPRRKNSEEFRGIPRDVGRSLEGHMPQPGGRESPGPRGRSTKLTQDQTNGRMLESAVAVGEPGGRPGGGAGSPSALGLAAVPGPRSAPQPSRGTQG